MLKSTTKAHTTYAYTVTCAEFNIYREFADRETAYLFAVQLQQDFPNAIIEKHLIRRFFDAIWE